ncbi:MAG: hypothetical protein JRH11_19780 [Deltaproteobacteria bacterium]|nr:hypothetical protein [Deltaproteobacteria bacterium]
MREKPFPDDIELLLATAARVGVVLDFCLLALDAPEIEAALEHSNNDADKTYRPPETDNRYLLSRKAAIEAMGVFSGRLRKPEPGREGFVLSVEETPRGEPISIHTLLGPEWCPSLRRVALRGKLSHAATDADQADASHYHDAWYHGRGYGVAEGPRGLTGAFFDPPYGLRTGEVKARTLKPGGDPDHGPWAKVTHSYPEFSALEQLFADLIDKLFYDLLTPVRCYRWSDDWSTYFDGGREWWGTGYWTSLILESEEILVIGASASD